MESFVKHARLFSAPSESEEGTWGEKSPGVLKLWTTNAHLHSHTHSGWTDEGNRF